MVLVTCKCLNIKVNIKQNPSLSSFDFIPVTGSGDNSSFLPFKVSQAESCDPGITLEQEYLVHRQYIGEWLVHRCLNCQLDVYVTKPRSSKILISQNVQCDSAVIERLQQSSNYSEVFGLVLSEKGDHVLQFSDRRPGGFESLQDEINLVQEQLTNYILHEETEMENRIKHYEDEQRLQFQKLQEKVRKEKKQIINIMHDAQKIKATSENRGSKGTINTPERLKPKVLASQKTPLSRTKSTPMPRGSSLEEFDQNAEEMFMLDDGLEPQSDEPFYKSEEESDSEDDSPSVRGAPSSVKKNKLIYSASVPISVPTWCPSNRDNADLEEYDEDGSLPSDPDQIAASMQALAQSIHNDERYIFGERPRPRLNTGDFSNM